MANSLTLDAQTLDLTRIFQDFYTVPNFQREYVWRRENVETLLNDVVAEFDRLQTRNDGNAEYFLGSIVVCKSSDGASFELIDGQQRMTTLYLIFCVIRDFIQEMDDSIPHALHANIRFSQVTPRGDEVHSYRVTLQYEEGKETLEQFGKGNEISDIDYALESTDLTSSTYNLLLAYRTIRDFLQEHYNQPQQLRLFWGNLLNYVKLIRIVTPDLTQALQIFETINQRGVGLDAVDLLKNLLFMNAPRSADDEIATKWKQMLDKIRQREKPLRFLRYFVLALYDVELEDPLTESEIYAWFRNNPQQHRLDDDPIAFLDKLVEYSNVYLNFIENKGSNGKDNEYLNNIGLATTTTARQHFILLMAAKHLPPVMFDRVCEELERLLYCYLITRQRTNVLERNIVRWAQKARNIYTEADLIRFFEDTLWGDLKRRRRDFDQAFLTLSLDNVPKYRIRYTLGKIVQYIEASSGRPAPNLTDIAPKRSSRNVPQIEHILPSSPTADIVEAFDKPDEFYQYCQALGNLTLLEKTINSSISNGSFSQKKLGYGNSVFLLTSSITEKPTVGQNTQFNRGTTLLQQFDNWDSNSIRKRQEMLLELARQIWMEVGE